MNYELQVIEAKDALFARLKEWRKHYAEAKADLQIFDTIPATLVSFNGISQKKATCAQISGYIAALEFALEALG